VGDELAVKTIEFCASLRRDHDFKIGSREALEAVRALEIVGIRERSRVAAALRAICCSKPEEVPIFNRAFEAFFSSAPRGIAQLRHPQRRRSIGEESPALRDAPTQRTPEAESLAQSWQALLARYSPAESAAPVPPIPMQGLDGARRQANRLIARLHLGRSRRWKPHVRGERFDLARTLRASLRTGGDLLEPRTLGHPLRNPRVIVLLDGSRSMSDYAAPALQFAYALCKRSRLARAFLFSTRIREVTRQLRDAERRAYRLEGLGEAWGGGTRIGASLREFVRAHAAALTDQTYVIVVSDGLDTGEIAQLRRAMREIARRCAAVAWVNPHAGLSGYLPSARGMQAALPYVSTLTSLDRLDALHA
jgi:uncharacterized protein